MRFSEEKDLEAIESLTGELFLILMLGLSVRIFLSAGNRWGCDGKYSSVGEPRGARKGK